MYEELIKRLRSEADCPDNYPEDSNLMREAADTIEQLSSAGSAYGRGWTLGYDAGRKESKPAWIPVTEQLPEDGEYVLAYSDSDCLWLVAARHKFSDWEITHWMPLPTPPKEGEG